MAGDEHEPAAPARESVEQLEPDLGGVPAVRFEAGRPECQARQQSLEWAA